MSEQYLKPPLSLEQQADLLLKRGLKDIDKQALIDKLANINYYRLRGYTYPYQDNAKEDSPFLQNVQWSFIWNDYLLDIQLRSLLFESISHIEVAFRTQLAYKMSVKYGSRWYTDNRYFYNKFRHISDLKELEKDWNRSQEDFKKHYDAKYDAQLSPPSWMIFETATFGVSSKFYENLENYLPEKAEIAKYFGFSKASAHIFVSWMKHLNTVRNICAHH